MHAVQFDFCDWYEQTAFPGQKPLLSNARKMQEHWSLENVSGHKDKETAGD